MKGEIRMDSYLKEYLDYIEIQGDYTSEMIRCEICTEERHTIVREIVSIGVDVFGKLPVVNFSAGGIASPADAALMMQIGVEGVFVGSGIFKSENPSHMAKAIVKATTHYNDPEMLVEISKGLGSSMPGLDVRTMPEDQKLAQRGW